MAVLGEYAGQRCADAGGGAGNQRDRAEFPGGAGLFRQRLDSSKIASQTSQTGQERKTR
jgi:hypothetical protein